VTALTLAFSQRERERKVHLEHEPDGVRVIRLADPARRNALDDQLRDELAAAVAAVAGDADARALVVRADGPAFSAGADLVAVFGGAMGKSVEQVRAELRRVYDSFLRIRTLEIPTLAAIRGPAKGQG
jgi:enoyl-CoA hydratase